ncbi:MAG TPA: ATP synthase F1 subunit epsilon [Ottowia sp.]|uniref:ATP synthase F1 subunit epsilon n=1 Tax=Ottowia sp. TaxID=1898956 RepID=UPI002626B3BC|nr:ATP synthase F1 subunit epsilon [Ottowia sp.]HPK32972.1 ATP synthase F1 subunit epsilon [Ottowia sp.]HPR44917.1 ATP synthase F1 subunit epsilon [Ottowia sp.]
MAEERPVPGAGKPFRLEVATLNGELFSGAVTYVEVPGEGGHLGVLHGHTPLLTQVAPGALNFHTAEGEARTLQVLGGIVEVAPWGVAVLADLAGRDAEAEEARMARARQSAAAHVPHAERAIGAAAVRAELDAELVRFFATALRKQPRR